MYVHISYSFQVGESLITRYPDKLHTDGLLQTASIGLKYHVRAKVIGTTDLLFFDELSLKCTAKIGNAYWQSIVQKTRIKRQGRMLESRANDACTSGKIEFSYIFTIVTE
jgi:hypothetical protein